MQMIIVLENFLGSYRNRFNLENTMFNLTGMVETDLYLINKIFISIKSKKVR